MGLASHTVVAGAYRVIRPIAEGGMAAIYEVEHLITGAHCALKIMGLRFAGDEFLEQRFMQEARVGASLKSDHIAKVVDAGVDPTLGMPFIAMELLEGVPLSTELRARGRFSPTEVLEILRQLCHAVGAAHRGGIVHRDLKPNNIFLARSGTAGFSFMIKVLDFGIARVLADANTEPETLQLGTPAWMAPEQTDPTGPIGPQTDVWAIGLLAYTLLTGNSYWRNTTGADTSIAAVLREIVLEPLVRASARAASQGCLNLIPAGFDDWFVRCVVRNPERRFADASEAFAGLCSVLPLGPAQEPVDLAPTENAVADSSGSLAPAFLSAAAERTTQVEGWKKRHTKRRARSRKALITSLCAGGVVSVLGGYWVSRIVLRSSTAESPLGPSAAATQALSQQPAAPTASVVLRLHGSNTIGAELAPALAEAFLRQRLGEAVITRESTAMDETRVVAHSPRTKFAESIEIAAHGTATAFQSLGEGRCDIGMASRRIHPAEAARLTSLGYPMSAASEHTIGLDGIAVVVSPQNPLNALTREQISRIFSGEFTQWIQVGGAESPIVTYSRDDRSGTLELFRSAVLGKKPLAAATQRLADAEQLSNRVAGDPNGIGFVGLPNIRDTKPIMIRDHASTPLLPSSVSVATEDYLLARRLYMYTPENVSPTARRFIDFALSDDGQQVVEKTGFVDLRPECDARANQCRGCSGTYRYLVRGACRFSVSFRFDEDGQKLDTRALRDLSRMTNSLARPPLAEKSIILLGFWDAPLDAATLIQISRQRAELVAAQLRARGMNVSSVVGMGADTRLADGTTEEGRRRNRRVEVWLR